MKKTILAISILFAISHSVQSFAATTPIDHNISLKNPEFSKMIFDALENVFEPIQQNFDNGSETFTINIAGGFACQRTDFPEQIEQQESIYECSLLTEGGWSILGRDVYSSGNNELLTTELYNSLRLDPEVDEDFSTKTLALEVPDGQGGTERNLLTCVRPSDSSLEFGFRATCQIIDAL